MTAPTAVQPLVEFRCDHPSGCRNAVRATPDSTVICNCHPRPRRMEPTTRETSQP